MDAYCALDEVIQTVRYEEDLTLDGVPLTIQARHALTISLEHAVVQTAMLMGNTRLDINPYKHDHPNDVKYKLEQLIYYLKKEGGAYVDGHLLSNKDRDTLVDMIQKISNQEAAKAK